MWEQEIKEKSHQIMKLIPFVIFFFAGIEQKSCFSYAKRCTKVSFEHIFVFL